MNVRGPRGIRIGELERRLSMLTNRVHWQLRKQWPAVRASSRVPNLTPDPHRGGPSALVKDGTRRIVSTSMSSRNSQRCLHRSERPPWVRVPIRRRRLRDFSLWLRQFTTHLASLPIVMTVANRAIGSPINIWNDHSDTMSQRFRVAPAMPADNQEAADLRAGISHSRGAFLLRHGMDGFILTHAVEQWMPRIRRRR